MSTIGNVYLYTGLSHPELAGKLVLATGVFREGQLLRQAGETLSSRDRVEVRAVDTASTPVIVWEFELAGLPQDRPRRLSGPTEPTTPQAVAPKISGEHHATGRRARFVRRAIRGMKYWVGANSLF